MSPRRIQAPRGYRAFRRRLRSVWKWLNLSEHTFSSMLISGVLFACFLLWGDWLQWNNLAASDTRPASFLRPRAISDTIGILSGLSAVAIGVQVLARTYQTDPAGLTRKPCRWNSQPAFPCSGQSGSVGLGYRGW